MIIQVVIVLITLSTVGGASADEKSKTTSQQVTFFETKVRPLLAKNCFACHGAKKHKGGLRLDSRSTMIAGGDSGPAIVPHKPEKSLLIEAINYKGLEMPPKGKLNDRDIGVLTAWVKMGAPWPNDKRVRPASDDGKFRITDKDRAYWAYQPIRQPKVPASAKGTHPIDVFIAARLQAKDVKPNDAADRQVLIRRAFFDLIGLPPTPEEVEEFVDSTDSAAFERLIEELANRPQYGERWGRHWLDVVRYGQTNGYERDDAKPHAWRFRDYVIKSFNDDKPFDRFIQEQLAGDELDDISHETIIATGFYRVGVWDDEPAEKTLALYDEMDDLVRVTGAAFLGLTIGCARCHNHMFDPISQQDYYEFLAFFKNVSPYGRDKGGNSETHWELNPSAVYTPLATIKGVAEWKTTQARVRKEVEQKKQALQNSNNDAKKKALQEEIKKLEESLKKNPFPMALTVREPNAKPPATHFLVRGDPRNKGKEIHPATLQIVSETTALATNSAAKSAPKSQLHQALFDSGVTPTSGRRRQLAEWIASEKNPLTARVIVNRVWQHLFGRGIVRTPNNFGKAGVSPTHPKLLDWLTARFVADGWRIKPLIKTIMLSAAYQRSSNGHNTEAASLDPANDLFWRHNLRRLDAEAIRDSVLAVSGQLNLKMGGEGFYPQLSSDVLATQSRPGAGWGKSDPGERNRRSVYIFVKRTLMVPMLETFDYNNTAEPIGVRPVTTVAPQALILLNGQFIEEKAAAFAQRVKTETGGEANAQIGRIFELALNRSPTDKEQTISKQILKQSGNLKSLCLVMFNTNEFVYLD